MQLIEAAELAERLQQGENLILIDVRERIEFHTYNIGGRHISLASLQEDPDQIEYNKTDEIIVICKAGLRSATAQKILTEKGFLNVRNLNGGLLALQKLKLKRI